MTEILIRAEQPTDFESIDNLVRLAFDKTQGEEVEVIRQSRQSADHLPNLALVAEWDGEVVGHLLFEHIELAGGKPQRVLALATMAVHPEHQHKGMGTQLIQHGLQLCRQRKEEMVVVLGHPEYYPKFGFLPSEVFGIRPFWDTMLVLPLTDDLSGWSGARVPMAAVHGPLEADLE